MQLLYYLLIYPIELILELVFSIAYRAVQNPGLSIIAVSIVMNFMIMPMYKKSDELQEKEREKQKEMEPWIKHIRRTFSGDERFMILQTYYRENNYKPIYSFRGSLSLILQIPFFIAAYHFLSHLSLLQGMSFGPIADLSVPDGVWKLAGMLFKGIYPEREDPAVWNGGHLSRAFISVSCGTGSVLDLQQSVFTGKEYHNEEAPC